MNNTSISENKTNENTIMTKEMYLQLVKEFKISANNKDFKPYWGDDWNGDKCKKAGVFMFEHYIFYAILRKRDYTKTTHDILSDTYIDALAHLKHCFKQINQVMPSLTQELFEKIINSK